MSPSSLAAVFPPAIELNCSTDNEYLITATDRATGKVLAAAMSYDCDAAVLRIDLQLIELGYSIYQPERY